MTATHPRGQAAVELALGSLVLVTVLLFGLQFGELLFVSLKVQESAITTRWDGTGQRTHRLPADFSLAPVAVANAGREGQSRHRDFDGRSSKRGSPWLVQAATAAHGMAVSCELKPMLKFPAGGIPPRWAGVYQDPGGLSCDAKAEVTVIRIPNEFAEGGSGFFQARHQGGPLTFSACGFGRPFAPSCSAGPAVLLDDWALTGADEGKECVLIDAERCKNPGYYASVEKLFTYGGRGKGDAASVLARDRGRR